MKRFRNRKLICASAMTLVVAILGTSVLSEAAGPGEIVSSLWSKRPKLKQVSESKLNPRNWMTRFAKPAGSSRVSDLVGRDTADDLADGRAASSIRPDLYEDPFAVSGVASETGDVAPAVAEKSSPRAALSPGQRREASRTSSRPMRDERENSGTMKLARRGAAENAAPALPEGLQDDSQNDARSPIGEVKESGPASAILQPDSANQFAPGFDSEFQRVVESVISETDSPGPETRPSTRAMSGSGGLRGPVQAPQLPNQPVGSDSPDSLLSRDGVETLIDRSRRDIATTLTISAERPESPLFTSRPGQ
ncbi:MAG: hypothetical protein H8E37_02915 [Planctomycetes bacterium]|nr:hypothetical protein [Planctomycetota bacterium]